MLVIYQCNQQKIFVGLHREVTWTVCKLLLKIHVCALSLVEWVDSHVMYIPIHECLAFTGDADLKSVKLAQKFSWNDHYVIPFVINKNVDSSFTWQVLFLFALT